MMGGELNRVTAVIYHNGQVIHHLNGKWDECFYLSDAKKKNVRMEMREGGYKREFMIMIMIMSLIMIMIMIMIMNV